MRHSSAQILSSPNIRRSARSPHWHLEVILAAWGFQAHPVCQADLEKMLTFTRDSSQPLAPAMLILFFWSHLDEFLSCLLPPYNTVTHWPLMFSVVHTVLLLFCWIHSRPNTRDWGGSSLKPAERQPFPFLSFTAVLTTTLLHYFCYVLFIMLAQQLVSSAILL